MMEINETIWKKDKEFLIDSYTQSKLINIRCTAYYSDSLRYNISSIEFSENNTKAILYYDNGGFLGGYLALDLPILFLKKTIFGSKQVQNFYGCHRSDRHGNQYGRFL